MSLYGVVTFQITNYFVSLMTYPFKTHISAITHCKLLNIKNNLSFVCFPTHLKTYNFDSFDIAVYEQLLFTAKIGVHLPAVSYTFVYFYRYL